MHAGRRGRHVLGTGGLDLRQVAGSRLQAAPEAGGGWLGERSSAPRVQGRVETVQSLRGAGCGQRKGSAHLESEGGAGTADPECPKRCCQLGESGVAMGTGSASPAGEGRGEGARVGVQQEEERVELRLQPAGTRGRGPPPAGTTGLTLAQEGGQIGLPALFRAPPPRASAQRPQGPASAGAPCGPAQPAQLWPVLGHSSPHLGPAGATHQAAGQAGGQEAQGGQSLGRVGFPQAFPSSRTHQCPWPG